MVSSGSWAAKMKKLNGRSSTTSLLPSSGLRYVSYPNQTAAMAMHMSALCTPCAQGVETSRRSAV